jgi:hypothetical protein
LKPQFFFRLHCEKLPLSPAFSGYLIPH